MNYGKIYEMKGSVERLNNILLGELLEIICFVRRRRGDRTVPDLLAEQGCSSIPASAHTHSHQFLE